ncbi:hypothetical protein JL720_15865 [Aureococcus anophagefferens]|nr:hypothetical protein JL720_15865 [Aureococcus anophagefferens]
MASNVDVDMAAANADAVAAQMDAMDVERVVEDDDGEMLIEDEGEDLGANYLEDDGSIEDGGDDGTFASLQQVEEQLKAGVEQPFKRAAERDDAESTLATHGDALGGHTDSVTTCGFSHTGTFAATGSYDGTVKLWDATTGNLARTLDGPGDVEWLKWHPKGDVVLCGSGDGVLDVARDVGRLHARLRGPRGPRALRAFTCDGKQIVTGSADGSVRVWAPKKGVCKHAWLPRGHGAPPGDRGMLLMSNGAITALDVHPSDPELVAAAAEDGTAVVLHCKSKKIVNALEHAVAKTVWDFAKLPARVSLVHNTAVVALAWFPKAAKLVSSSADLSVKVWDARSGACERDLRGHTDIPWPWRASRTATRVLSVGDDTTGKLPHP